MLIVIYRLLLWFSFPLLLIYTLTSSLTHRCPSYLLQRLGFALPILDKQPLWIHCASVGELNVALLLISAWHRRYPQDLILITSTTISSKRVFESQQHLNVHHCYLPLDYVSFSKRFLKCIRPRATVIVETEIWLNLFKNCAEHNVPIAIVNARVSQRTSKQKGWLRAYYEQSLAHTRIILAKSERDYAAYLALGALPWKTKTIGNLKYAIKVDNHLPNLINQPYLLAASTHDDEELQIARAWQAVKKNSFVLVIAPRHPQRTKKILRSLKKNKLRACCYLENGYEKDTNIIIFNRIGQLKSLMKHARLVFLGGSLVAKGGHNLLEAAALGTPQATGHYLDNVVEEAQALNNAGALIIIDNAASLIPLFKKVVTEPNSYAQNAKAAQDYLSLHADVAERYVEELERLGFQP